jgi:hypothetical protein
LTEQEVPVSFTTGLGGESTATFFDDAFTSFNINRWFNESTDRTPLPLAAIEDQPPLGDLQAYRQASNALGPEQCGTSVLSSTRPTATIPILLSSSASEGREDKRSATVDGTKLEFQVAIMVHSTACSL